MEDNRLSSLASIDDIGFKMPAADSEDNLTPEVIKLLDTTDPGRIFLTSDWHFFKNHYKKEANYVNTQHILKWCKDNIKPDDVFLYLGDISFRYANQEDKDESAKLIRSIPGHKILIIGNHDNFCGQEYYDDCGFEYAFEELKWKDIIFTHRPIKMDTYPESMWNIHGHIHNIRCYNTTDGKRNINVYPLFYDNKPATMKYILSHKDQLVKHNTWNNNAGLGESAEVLTEKVRSDVNYENPMGRKIVKGSSSRSEGSDLEILSGDAIDVEIKNTLETFDVKRHKLLLESKNIVEDYNAFIQCNFQKNVKRDESKGVPSYSQYFKYFARDCRAHNGEPIPEDKLRRYMQDEYHESDDPAAIRRIVELRIKYINGVNSLLKEIITNNRQLLGISSDELEALIKGLSSDDTSGKSVAEIKDIILKNRSKFIKQDRTVLDLRPLGAGVFVGSKDDKDHLLINEDIIKVAIQRCLTYDLVLTAHGNSNNKIDMGLAQQDLARILKGIEREVKEVISETNSLGQGLTEYDFDANAIAGRIALQLYDNYVIQDKAPTYDNDFKKLVNIIYHNYGQNSFSGYVSQFPESEQKAVSKKIFIRFKNWYGELHDFYKKYDITSYRVKNDGKYVFTFDIAKSASDKWHFNITYLDGKEYHDVKQVLKMAKAAGFDKILLQSCNPKGLDLPKDLVKHVTFGKHSVYKEAVELPLHEEYSDIYATLDSFESDYRALAEEFNIDYDNDVALNEAAEYVMSNADTLDQILTESVLVEAFKKVIAFIVKVISFIISLVKKFIEAIKKMIAAVHDMIKGKKPHKVKKSKVKASFINISGSSAAMTSEKEVESQKDLEDIYKKAIETAVKAMKGNSDTQVRLEKSLKSKCETLQKKAERGEDVSESTLIDAFAEATDDAGVQRPKAKVFYSREISPRVIKYMVSMYKDRLEGNIAIKLHVGEEGNQNALPVRLIRPTRDELKATYIDSNVAYNSKRKTTEGHLQTAEAHGFDNLDVLDADGDFPIPVNYINKINREIEKSEQLKSDYIPKCSRGPHLEEVHVGSHLKNYDSMIVYSHFKGHVMAGYGGAIKNIGMGIPSGARGKMEVHGKDFMPGPDFLERLVESAGTIADYFHGKVIYINVLKNMSVDCDCDAVAHNPTIPDIGVLVSDDIIAIEQASMDLVRNCQRNKDLMERISDKGGFHQIFYGSWLWLGNIDYELYTLDGSRLKLEHGLIREYDHTKHYMPMQTLNEAVQYTRLPIDEDVIRTYRLKHLRTENCTGVALMDGPALLGVVNVESKPNGEKWIQALEVSPMYRNRGVGRELLQIATDELGAKYLSVRKDNTVARRLYEDAGWKYYKESGVMYFMSLESMPEIQTEALVLETKRSNLPDSAFGLPEERKYPLDTAQHVRSAIRLFGHCPEGKKKQLAKRIRRAATKYGIEIPETTQVYKYLHEAAFIEAEGPVGNLSISVASFPDTVKNIVFDIGSVLANAKTLEAIQTIPGMTDAVAKDIYDYVTQKLFYRSKFDTDVKKYNILQIREFFDKTAPESIKPFKDQIFGSFARAMYYYDYTFQLIKFFKDKGYSVYYLSNWDFYSYQLESTFFSQLVNAMDGGLFSFETDYEKPDPAFFKLFFDKYNLDPTTCVFFDDRIDNVEVARTLGMHAYVFDCRSTAEQIMNPNPSADMNSDTMLVVDNTAGFDIIPLSDIPSWYVGYANPNDDTPDPSNVFTHPDMAVQALVNSKAFNDPEECADADDPYHTTSFVWAELNPDLDVEAEGNDGFRQKWLPVGRIIIDTRTGNYEWEYQNPLKRINGVYYRTAPDTGLAEWAMAACNPIQGIRKPFILKVGCDTGGIINTKQYAFSPDVINDKYLAINEDGVLDFVDASEYDNCLIEEYEYVGDPSLLAKIYEAYSSKKIVDNTFFYTALTGKPMLTEDQIDFDDNFRKVDFNLMLQQKLSRQATFEAAANIAFGGADQSTPVMESALNLNRISSVDEISVQKDSEGYYLYNSLTGKRSVSYERPSMLTESVAHSIL